MKRISGVIFSLAIAGLSSSCSAESPTTPVDPVYRQIYEKGIDFKVGLEIDRSRKIVDSSGSAPKSVDDAVRSEIRINLLNHFEVNPFTLKGMACVIFIPKRGVLGKQSLVCFDENWNVIESS